MKKQCLEVADYAFLLKKDNRVRWEKTFCRVLGCDVQSVVHAGSITPEHMQTFFILRKYVPALPDDNTRGWVKEGIANMLGKALTGDPYQYCGTPEQMDDICQWYESEMPAGGRFEKQVNGQVEQLIQRWKQQRKAQSAEPDRERQRLSHTPSMPVVTEVVTEVESRSESVCPGSTDRETVSHLLPDLIPDKHTRHQPEAKYPPGLEQSMPGGQKTAWPDLSLVEPPVSAPARSDQPVVCTPQPIVCAPQPVAVRETGPKSTTMVSQPPQVLLPQTVMTLQPGWLVKRYLIVPASMLTNDLIEGIKRIELSVTRYLDIVAQGQATVGDPPQWLREEVNHGRQHLCRWLKRYCRNEASAQTLNQALGLLVATGERGEIDRQFDEMISDQVCIGNVMACDELIRVRDCLFKVRQSLGLPVNRI